MTYSELEAYLYTLISGNTSLSVIFSDENGVRPDGNYLTLKITSFNKVGQKDYTIPNEITGIRESFIHEDFVISLISYGRGTQDNLQNLKITFEKESIQESMRGNNIVIRDSSLITDISTVIDEVIEKRFLFEVTMGFGYSFNEMVGIIETIEYTPTYNEPT